MLAASPIIAILLLKVFLDNDYSIDAPKLQSLIIGDTTPSTEDCDASHCFYYCSELCLKRHIC